MTTTEQTQDQYQRRQGALMAFDIERQRIERAMTPEEVVGLGPEASPREARLIYFRGALQVHPHKVRLYDPSLEGDATKVMALLADAYAQIKTKNRR